MSDQDKHSHISYEPRRLTALGGGYSKLVRILKFTLPVVALIIIGVLVARLTEDPQQKMAAVPTQEKTTPGMIELVQPKYEGRDEQGRPYTVTADKATRAMNAPDTVLFENPLADILLQDKSWVAVRAATGRFDRIGENMTLTQDVTVYHDSGYEMNMQQLTINLKQKNAVSTTPVTAHGPMGTITAANMVVTDQGNLIVFGGPVQITFFRLSQQKGRG